MIANVLCALHRIDGDRPQVVTTLERRTDAVDTLRADLNQLDGIRNPDFPQRVAGNERGSFHRGNGKSLIGGRNGDGGQRSDTVIALRHRICSSVINGGEFQSLREIRIQRGFGGQIPTDQRVAVLIGITDANAVRLGEPTDEELCGIGVGGNGQFVVQTVSDRRRLGIHSSALTGSQGDAVFLCGPAGIEYGVAVALKTDIVISLSAGKSRRRGEPSREIIAVAAGFRQADRVAECHVDRLDRRAAADVEFNTVNVYRNGLARGFIPVFIDEGNGNIRCAGFQEGYFERVVLSVHRVGLRSDFYAVSACRNDRSPTENAVFIHDIAHAGVIDRSGLGIRRVVGCIGSYRLHGYRIHKSSGAHHIFGNGKGCVGHVINRAVDVYLITGCALNLVPTDHIPRSGNAVRTCQRGLGKADRFGRRAVIAGADRSHLHGKHTRVQIRNAVGSSAGHIRVFQDRTALGDLHIVGSGVFHRIPCNVSVVNRNARYGIQTKVVCIGSNRLHIPICLRHHNEHDTVRRHIAVCKNIVGGIAVVDCNVRMVCIRTSDRDQVVLSIRHRVKHQNASGYHAEVGHTVQRLILIVCGSGLSVTGHGNGILARRPIGKVELEFVCADVLVFQHFVTHLDGDAVACRRTKCVPADLFRVNGNVRNAGGLEDRKQNRILGQLLTGVLIGQFVAGLIVTDPPACKLRPFLFGSGKPISNSVDRADRVVNSAVAGEGNLILRLSCRMLLKARIHRCISADDRGVESERGFVLFIGIPSDKRIPVLGGIRRLCGSIAVENFLRLDRASAVHVKADGVVSSQHQTVSSAVIGQLQHAVLQNGGRLCVVPILERERQLAVCINKLTGLLPVESGEQEGIPCNGEQVFFSVILCIVDVVYPVIRLTVIGLCRIVRLLLLAACGQKKQGETENCKQYYEQFSFVCFHKSSSSFYYIKGCI